MYRRSFSDCSNPFARGARLGIATLWLCLLCAQSGLAQDSAQAAEELVRGVWYEGLPLERAAEIDAAGAARLVAMLNDPVEREHHGNILMALAASGQAGAYEAMAAFAARRPVGEIDRATFRAWQVLPHAFGELARREPRALAWLTRELEEAPVPAWRFRHHGGARLQRLRRRGVASGLARSRQPAATAVLQRAERRFQGDPRFLEHLRACRAELEASP